jgi:hypothetical protein
MDHDDGGLAGARFAEFNDMEPAARYIDESACRRMRPPDFCGADDGDERADTAVPAERRA